MLKESKNINERTEAQVATGYHGISTYRKTSRSKDKNPILSSLMKGFNIRCFLVIQPTAILG